MRVLLITGSFPPMRCGVGDYTSHLAHALAARGGVEVGVLTSREAASGATADLQLFPIIDGWRFTELPRILRVLRSWRPDVIHVQYPTKGYRRRLLPVLLPLICRTAGFRVAQTWHEYRRDVTLPALIWFASQWPVSGGVVFVRPRFEELMAPSLRASLRRKIRAFIPNASVIPRTR